MKTNLRALEFGCTANEKVTVPQQLDRRAGVVSGSRLWVKLGRYQPEPGSSDLPATADVDGPTSVRPAGANREPLAHLTKGLTELGWSEGRNLHLDIRWAPGNTELMRASAKELVGLQPNVIVTQSTPVTAAVRRETSTIPIVFAAVADPVGSGFVATLSRPGGNVTGFGSLQESMASKWLELLTGVAPGVKRAAMMFNPDTAPYMRAFMLPPFEAAARALNVAPITAPVRSDAEIEEVISELGREPGGGLFGMPDNFVEIHRAHIVKLAAQYGVPAVYQTPVIARDGGLLSYGSDFSDIFYRSARYVDSILRGANPAELPVQLPTKYFMVVNVATAKALGVTVPSWILLSADEVIE